MWLPLLLHPFWKALFIHVCPCMAQWTYSSHLSSGFIPLLECEHVSENVWMSLWPPRSATPPLHSCVQQFVLLCDPVCMCHISLLWPHTSVRMCSCISIYVHINLTFYICPTPFTSLHVNMDAPVWPCVSPSQSSSGPRPWIECVHVLVCVCMSTWLPMHA